MARIEQRRVRFQAVLGLLLTLLIVTAEFFGHLQGVEKRVYDWRAQHCQHFSKPPTDRLVHLDITDRDLELLGPWPWSRGTIAQILDELNAAGVRAVGFDILFDQRLRPADAESAAVAQPAATQPAVAQPAVDPLAADPDAALSAAIGRSARVVAAASLPWKLATPPPPGTQELLELLTADPEMSPANVTKAIEERGIKSADAEVRVAADFIALRQQALRRRIAGETIAGDLPPEELRRRIVRRADATSTLASINSLIDDQYEQVKVLRRIRPFTRDAGQGLPRAVEAGDGKLPVLPVASRISGLGFADYVVPTDDAVVRSIPLWADHRNRLLPQFGFALACAMLDVKPADVRLEADRIVLPAGAGRAEIVIPVHRAWFEEFGEVSYLLDVPWVGGPRWETMYDFPGRREAKQHLPVDAVWASVRARAMIARNDRKIDAAMRDVMATGIAPEEPVVQQDGPLRAEQVAKWAGLAEAVSITSGPGPLADAAEFLVKAPATQIDLHAALDTLRKNLRSQLGGRAVLMGWAATGNVDFYPTSIHSRCPGAVVHGAVFNAILTGEFWRRSPAWVAPLVTLGVGAVATLIVTSLSPLRAMLAVTLLIGAFATLNAVLLFDYANLIVNAAGPLLAAGLVWSGVTLLGFVTEVAERGRITKRFQAYVDPNLVNYVLENPDKPAFEGHEREMTVVFTDLEGFTALSEKLRGGIVKLLARYIELMVPVIRSHHGYVNKFLGDGIMFFFGAPLENPDHAKDALTTLLELQRALEPFNRELEAQELPTLSMRAGVSTGTMFVGDAGPSFASEFTVLGDRVNLASRLESANKVTGSRNLVTSRTIKLAGDAFLSRPVARLKVAGKSEAVFVYEVLGLRDGAGEKQVRLAELSKQVFERFQAGDLSGCGAAAEDVLKEFGDGDKFARLYLDRCSRGRDEGAAWDGHILLSEK